MPYSEGVTSERSQEGHIVSNQTGGEEGPKGGSGGKGTRGPQASMARGGGATATGGKKDSKDKHCKKGGKD